MIGEGTDPSRRRVEANGIEFAILEAGSGPLALCLHGFPDTAHTWRHLLPELAGAGFHAVAPFSRGYAPTGLAADDCYRLSALVADAVGLHEALGGDERSVLIGHDWGAEAAYGAAALAPERWRSLVTLAIPPLALDERLFSDYDQLKRFFYLFFLKGPEAVATVAADGMAFLDRLWEEWSPGFEAGEEIAKVKRALARPESLAAALAYYQSDESEFGGPDEEDPYAAEREALGLTPPQPTLYLHGDRDGCIGVELVGDAERHLSPGSRLEIVAGAGHFPQLERPDEVNPRILAWLEA